MRSTPIPSAAATRYATPSRGFAAGACRRASSRGGSKVRRPSSPQEMLRRRSSPGRRFTTAGGRRRGTGAKMAAGTPRDKARACIGSERERVEELEVLEAEDGARAGIGLRGQRDGNRAADQQVLPDVGEPARRHEAHEDHAVRRARSGPTDRKRTQPELRLTDVIDALRWNVLPGIPKTTAVVQGFLSRTRRRPRTVLGDVHAVVRDLHDAGCKLREQLHPGDGLVGRYLVDVEGARADGIARVDEDDAAVGMDLEVSVKGGSDVGRDEERRGSDAREPRERQA